MSAPFVSYIYRNPDASLDESSFPGNLRFVPDLRVEFDNPVTFFVGENGSGKSTLLEAIAVLAGFPVSGGGTNEVDTFRGLGEQSALANALRLGSERRARDGYFFRAELQAHFASLLIERQEDPHFTGDPYARYGGKSLTGMSHGEAFLSVMQNRFTEGLFLLDEPESALSPQRQLTLLAIIYDLVKNAKTQFIIATHSPILLTYPRAHILSFDNERLENERLESVKLAETAHYQITRGILTSPGSYWKHLINDGSDDENFPG